MAGVSAMVSCDTGDVRTNIASTKTQFHDPKYSMNREYSEGNRLNNHES